MKALRPSQVLRVDAMLDLGIGALLLAGTWDGLYDALDLPQAHPALLAQIGGALLVAFAYLLWVAPTNALLARHVSSAAALANALAAGVIAIWLVFSDPQVDTLGTVELSVAAVVLAAFALLEVGLARSAPSIAVQPEEKSS